jgi:hypothetical protein
VHLLIRTTIEILYHWHKCAIIDLDSLLRALKFKFLITSSLHLESAIEINSIIYFIFHFFLWVHTNHVVSMQGSYQQCFVWKTYTFQNHKVYNKCPQRELCNVIMKFVACKKVLALHKFCIIILWYNYESHLNVLMIRPF